MGSARCGQPAYRLCAMYESQITREQTFHLAFHSTLLSAFCSEKEYTGSNHHNRHNHKKGATDPILQNDRGSETDIRLVFEVRS